MEALIIFVVIIALMLIVGFSVEFVLECVMGLMCLMMLALFLFFGWCIVRLTVSEKCSGRLARVEKHPKFGYGIPFYDIGGEVFANTFPCEVVMKGRLYAEGRECRLMLDKKRNKVFDGNAVLSSVAGLFLSGLSVWVLVMQISDTFGYYEVPIFR